MLQLARTWERRQAGWAAAGRLAGAQLYEPVAPVVVRDTPGGRQRNLGVKMAIMDSDRACLWLPGGKARFPRRRGLSVGRQSTYLDPSRWRLGHTPRATGPLTEGDWDTDGGRLGR